MSGDLRPWIRDYLINVAETYGGNLSSAPLEKKGKKAQIIEFLTVGTENQESAVWAMVHDKALIVPVKFSKEAVMECNKFNCLDYMNSVSGRRLTETKTALVTLKQFRPFSTRIPFRNGGMTPESQLALHCDSVSIVGSLGENRWGNPKELDSDPDLLEWSHALRQHGGAGNILKERKKAREGENHSTTPLELSKRVVSPPKPSFNIKPVVKARSKDPLHEWRKRWHAALETPLDSVRPSTPPRPPPEDARDLGSSSPPEKYSVTSSPSDKCSRSSSPISGWSPTTVGSSPKRIYEDSRSPTPEESPRKAISSSCPEKGSSCLTAPTPAQRRRPSPAPSPGPRQAASPPTGRILVPNSDSESSQPVAQSPVMSTKSPVMSPDPPAPAPIDEEVLSEDDETTDRRLFRRPGSPLERGGPAKKRRMVNHKTTARPKLDGFRVEFDYIEPKDEWQAVGWDRVLAVLQAAMLQLARPLAWGLAVLTPRRDSLLFLMSISLGGLGIMSLRNPLGEWAGFVYARGDRIFCILVFSIVFLVLDDTSDEPDTRDKVGAPHRRGTPPSSTVPFDHGSPFHFANRATVSLRTPKHVFHSFGIFTVAAIIPARADRGRPRRDRDPSTIVTDSWFIGAFGKWYRGGVLDAWYQDVVARSSDEESWTSGILGMKALDKLNEYDGLPFSTKNLPTARSPPKLRSREKSSQRLPARSSTPPPLPKSASLPLHTPRPSPADRLHASQPNLSSQPTLATEQVVGSPILSRSPSTIFDQSPRIVEVLHQISLSSRSVQDLRNQLIDFQTSSSAAHASLQTEVDSFRDRKRQEDMSRSELKARTKALDDSKRAAESVKKDVEKRLKAAQNARDDANQRMAFLDKEISTLQQRLVDDKSSMLQSQEVSQPEQEIAEALEQRRQEIKVAEDVIAALNLRARELEDKLSSEKDRLKLARERAELRRQDRSFQPHNATSGPWALAPRNLYDSNTSSAEALDTTTGRGRRSSDPYALPTSPRPAKLTLGSISNFNNGPALGNLLNPAPRSNGYSIFDDVFLNQPSLVSGNFSPFGEPDLRFQVPLALMSPTSQSLIPSGLMSSLDSSDGSSRSFQSESDAFMDKEWKEASLHRTRSQQSSPNFGVGPITVSPTSLHGPSANDYERDPFEVHVPLTSPPAREREYRTSEASMDMQRVTLAHRTHSDPTSNKEDAPAPSSTAEKAVSRRWFTSNKDKPKKGLNPDAKEFSLPKKATTHTTSPRPTAYDALNPNGLGSNMMAPTSASHSLLRAFAPSPAEREALHRGLGGSGNASLERLPSLSDMGSIPSSPALAHAVPAAQRAIDGKMMLPTWLSSLPRIRKPNFSPWEDEEPVTTGGQGEEGR
ncbi:Proteophosphoglycan ppg4 [Mycena sanguinolenta]|uniref:Proteophosphoglycan ppg4 n=1 Tax=Mycena sanguinolenta TaxID=230812 RepID=A0A8H6ZET0_9AGAR|nr:Proteophosphoglycan ppg4 [Mycena sanguinolenta]